LKTASGIGFLRALLSHSAFTVGRVQDQIEPTCRLDLHRRQGVRVRVERYVDLRMPEAFLHDRRMVGRCEQEHNGEIVSHCDDPGAQTLVVYRPAS
jgi:hypothetical protein